MLIVKINRKEEFKDIYLNNKGEQKIINILKKSNRETEIK